VICTLSCLSLKTVLASIVLTVETTKRMARILISHAVQSEDAADAWQKWIQYRIDEAVKKDK
jgi:hypothetical protein